MDSLRISIASILATFNIAKAKDEQGRDIEPDIKWIPGFTMYVWSNCLTTLLKDAIVGTLLPSHAPSHLAPRRP